MTAPRLTAGLGAEAANVQGTKEPDRRASTEGGTRALVQGQSNRDSVAMSFGAWAFAISVPGRDFSRRFGRVPQLQTHTAFLYTTDEWRKGGIILRVGNHRTSNAVDEPNFMCYCCFRSSSIHPLGQLIIVLLFLVPLKLYSGLQRAYSAQVDERAGILPTPPNYKSRLNSGSSPKIGCAGAGQTSPEQLCDQSYLQIPDVLASQQRDFGGVILNDLEP